MYQVWCDGASKGNPGPSGCAFLIKYPDGSEVVQDFHEPHSTNNKMELTAAILALSNIPTGSNVVITTDSEYVRQGITSWIHNWKKKNWKNAKGKAVANKDLWVLLDRIVHDLHIEWKWVKGHSGDHYNDIVDKAASEACYGTTNSK